MSNVVNDLALAFLPYALAIFILGIFCTIFYKKIVGKAGEFHVKNELKKLPQKEYLIINDYMLETNGITHQIDHIVVSKYGIFVIETKQYNGYIYGNEYDNKWKQNNKYYINNPIHQNYGHVKSLEEALNLDFNKFIPIVCIPSTAKLKIKSKSYVLKIYNLNPTILSYKDVVLENYQEIYKNLLELNITDKDIRKKHSKYAIQVQLNKENKSLCPKCGGTLVERNGKYGKFIGCSNYPRCKYIKR